MRTLVEAPTHVIILSIHNDVATRRKKNLVQSRAFRAQLRILVKRILRKHGYPPDKQEKATQTVLEQAALLSAEWASA